jgi:pimeloyl-ACP methyl ester carboxylesterase
MTSQAELKLVTESYMIQSRDPGIQLHVRNKRPEGMAQFSPERTLLYVHGTTQAASSTFDLPLDGFSWMDYIAQSGYDVYLVDLRAYGRSTRPPEMEKPAAENPPIVRTDVAVKDVEAAVDHILARRGLTKLNLMGWSWGTAIMGRYATQNSDKVNRLVLYAPGLDTRSAINRQSSSAWGLSNMDDGASEEPLTKWRAGRKEKRFDAGRMVRNVVCGRTCHRPSWRQANTARCAHSKRHRPRQSGILDGG